MRRIVLLVSLVIASTASAQQVEVETLVLDNGMKFLLVPGPNSPTRSRWDGLPRSAASTSAPASPESATFSNT